MNLILGATPDCAWRHLLPLIQHIGFQAPDQWAMARWHALATDAALARPGPAIPTDSQAISQSQVTASQELLASCHADTFIDMTEHPSYIPLWLEVDSTSQLLFFHSRPIPALCRAMARCKPPGEALAAWQKTTHHLLDIVRRQRQRTLLVDVDQALLAPNLFLKTCRQAFGLDAPPWLAPLTTPDLVTDEFLHLIAAQQVTQTEGMADLLGELEARSATIGCEAAPPLIDCDRIWASLQPQPYTGTPLVQDAYTSVDLVANPRIQPGAVIYERLDQARLQQEISEAKEENELLLHQLHQVQEELERHSLASQSQGGQHGYLQVQIEAERRARLRAEARCESMKQTLSWRITAPLRWGLKSLRRRAIHPN